MDIYLPLSKTEIQFFKANILLSLMIETIFENFERKYLSLYSCRNWSIFSIQEVSQDGLCFFICFRKRVYVSVWWCWLWSWGKWVQINPPSHKTCVPGVKFLKCLQNKQNVNRSHRVVFSVKWDHKYELLNNELNKYDLPRNYPLYQLVKGSS